MNSMLRNFSITACLCLPLAVPAYADETPAQPVRYEKGAARAILACMNELTVALPAALKAESAHPYIEVQQSVSERDPVVMVSFGALADDAFVIMSRSKNGVANVYGRQLTLSSEAERADMKPEDRQRADQILSGAVACLEKALPDAPQANSAASAQISPVPEASLR